MQEELLELTRKGWDAEEENARRIALRSNILLTLAGTLAGLGMLALKLGLFAEGISQPSLRVLVFLLVFGTLVCLVLAVVSLLVPLGRAGPSRNTASKRLLMSVDEVRSASGLSKEHAAKLALVRTYTASKELNSQNRAARDRVDTGQQYLIAGAVVAALAVIAYTAGTLLAGPASPSKPLCGCDGPSQDGAEMNHDRQEVPETGQG